jgi:hypothetical protein
VLGVSEELLYLDMSYGSGFLQPPLQSLPFQAVFTTLSGVDRAMARCQGVKLSIAETKLLNDARSFAKHSILSLAAWACLTDNEREIFHHGNMYESARLAAIIYSNAVIFPIPIRSPGIQSAVLELRKILRVCDLAAWTKEAPGFVLWLLLIGGLSSYRTQHWPFFVTALNEWIRTSTISSFDTSIRIVNGYIWSDEACLEGAVVMWTATANKHPH